MNSKTPSLQPFLVAYSKADSAEDFIRLFDSLSVLPFEDFLRFIKRSSCYQYCATFRIKENGNPRTVKIIHPEYFWNSQLTLRWGKELFCSDNAEEFLFGLFSKTENYNGQLLKEIAHYNPLQLIRSIKLKKCFLEDELFSKLHFMKIVPDQRLNTFYEEITAIKKLDEDWLEKKRFYQSVIEEFPVEEILVQTVSYYEKFKRSSSYTTNNRAYQISREVCLITVLNYILAERKDRADNIQPKMSISEVYSMVSHEMPPLNTPEGIAKGLYLVKEEISGTKRIIREALEFYFSYLHGFLYQVDKYCVGLADVVEITGNKVQMLTNRRYQYSRRDDKKNGFVESYFSFMANDSEALRLKNTTARDMNERQENLTLATYLQHFDFMKINVVKHGTSEFKPEELIRFLWTFAQWLMPQGRNIINVPQEETKEGTWMQPIIMKRQIPEDFTKLFPQSYLVAFDEQHLLRSSKEYFGWDFAKCKAMLEYLTYNMTGKEGHYDFPEYPFISIGSNYYWLSSFLRDRHWFNILSRRIQKEIHRDQSKLLEQSIAELFFQAGFGSAASVNYKDEEVREIDCIAYKDGCLFLVELKTTHPSEDLIRQSEFDSRKLEHKAVNQIERALEFYESNFDFFKAIPELKIDKAQEDIKVYTLIVTNIFEQDGALKGQRHLKISLFGLMILLKNDLYRMLNSNMSSLFPDNEEMKTFRMSFQLLEAMNNTNNPYRKKGEVDTSEKACDLYDGKPITAKGFVLAIKQDKVWMFLDQAYHFNFVERIELGQFDKDYRWLD